MSSVLPNVHGFGYFGFSFWFTRPPAALGTL